MTAVRIPCPRCFGQGWRIAAPSWVLCAGCDGIGKTWSPGAPSFGCSILLGSRVPGEIVTLGNGDRGKLLWHSPRGKDKKRPPETSYIGLIDEFDNEDHRPTAYPSCVGVSSVGIPRGRGDDDHYGDRSADVSDPMQQRRGNTLF